MHSSNSSLPRRIPGSSNSSRLHKRFSRNRQQRCTSSNPTLLLRSLNSSKRCHPRAMHILMEPMTTRSLSSRSNPNTLGPQRQLIPINKHLSLKISNNRKSSHSSSSHSRSCNNINSNSSSHKNSCNSHHNNNTHHHNNHSATTSPQS